MDADYLGVDRTERRIIEPEFAGQIAARVVSHRVGSRHEPM